MYILNTLFFTLMKQIFFYNTQNTNIKDINNCPTTEPSQCQSLIKFLKHLFGIEISIKKGQQYNTTVLKQDVKWNSLFFPSAKKAYIMRMLIFFLNDTRKTSMISAGYSNDCLYDVAVLKLLMAPVQSSNLGYMQQTDKPSEY